jgi:hypothetical protein
MPLVRYRRKYIPGEVTDEMELEHKLVLSELHYYVFFFKPILTPNNIYYHCKYGRPFEKYRGSRFNKNYPLYLNLSDLI